MRSIWLSVASFTVFLGPFTFFLSGPQRVEARQPTPVATATAEPAPATSPASSPAPTVDPSPANARNNSSLSVLAASAATPRALGLHTTAAASFTYISQNTRGPGSVGPVAAGFIAGSPLAPNTPYDLFSSAPLVGGNTGVGQLIVTPRYATRAFDFDLTAGAATSRGSVTNAAYWGESLIPPLNPHVGSQALPYAVAFPTHPGGDDGGATRFSILAGGIATADGSLRVRGGWFDLAQTDRFVFAQPALTNLNPAIAYAPAETVSNGLAGLDGWQPYASALPLHGVDIVAKRGMATLELSSAALPSLPGDTARISSASLVFGRSEGTRLSGEVVHVVTAGTPFVTTVPFGLDPTFTPTEQGVLPTSVLSGQRQTIAGLRGAFHIVRAAHVDGVVEIGRSWYDARPVVRPGTAAPGGYYHAALIDTHGRVTVELDFYRMEPRYAPAILPYGVPENQWSAAFAWPGQWLKSNYQLIDNSVLGVNRQGYRLRYLVDRGPFELHLEYTDVHQIDAETIDSSQQTGFVDGYYLPQLAGAATFGRQKRAAVWAAWHPAFGDLTLDIVDDTEYRPFVATHPEDSVAYEVPQAMLDFSRHLSSEVVASMGLGRYAMKGAFAEPIDFAQRLFFAGVEIRQSPHASLLATFRRGTFGARSTNRRSSDAPNFASSTVVVEERLHV